MAPTDPSMFPELPADLAALTDDELTELKDEFQAVARDVKAKDADTLGDRTAEQIIEQMQAGVAAIEQIAAEQTERAEAETNFNNELEALGTRAGVDAEAETPEGDDGGGEGNGEEGDGEEAPAEEPSALEPVAASGKTVRRPLPPARRHRAQANQMPDGTQLVASTRVYPQAEPGEALDSRRLAEVMTELVNKTRITPGERVVVASATFPFPEERMLGRDLATNAQKLEAVIGTESMTASGGLCAPLTPIYSMPSVETAARPVRDALAGFRADRGGVIVPENPVITDYADAVGTVTAEDDEMGGTFAVKNCMRIECPTFTSVEVDSIYRCIEIGNLTGRAYPELLTRVDTLVMANHARLADTILLDGIKAGSVGVTDVNTTSTAGAVWKLLGYLGASVAGMRSRNRMASGTRIRGLFPEWLPEAIQTDLGRADFTRDYARAEAEALFARMGINASFYLDGPSTGTAQVFGAQTAGNLLPYPTATQYALFPEGSWLHLDSGSLDLGIVRDSTLNSTNDYQVFAETWEQVALVGVESQWHTATLSFNGTFSAGKDFSAATSF